MTVMDQRVDQILKEERAYPTVSYAPSKSLDLAKLIELTMSERGIRPRSVRENPHDFVFKSVNYELLSSLSAQFDEDQRLALRSHLLHRIGDLYAVKKVLRSEYPIWNSYTSELPLVVEYLIRVGASVELFDWLAKVKPTPGVILLLLELQELVALNWSILSDSELEQLLQKVAILGATARKLRSEQAKLPTAWTIEGERVSVSLVARDCVSRCDELIELCRKARYLVLKSDLLRDVNLEVNQDKNVVESYLKQLGFSPNLIQSLNEADKLQLSPSPFDLKSSMGHLRSFLENLHIEAGVRVATKSGGGVPAKWGATVAFLHQSRVLTKQEEGFVTGLYTFISDGAVHPLIAEREYARLSRNVVIEYGLLLLRKLDKFGLPK
jgi:flagellar biosynthesis/type III secretory pathway chaperone